MPERRFLFRFGSFELDCASRELRKRGVRIKLEEQPFRLLEELLMRQGQVLPREELKKALWSDGVCGNLDRSLTRVMNKVRIALGDTADNPRFIETLPRRGYRFVAPVSIAESADEQDLSDRKPTDNSPLGLPEPSLEIGVQAATKRRLAAAALIAAGAMTVTKLLLAD
jgi:DNA-binding winged helix-turn-helix (wHTH) protein